MKFKNILRVIETHTAGNPTRHILLGVPPLVGKTMEEKMDYFKEHYDHIRKIITMEPRGHSCMSGVIYTTPCNQNADIGIFFVEQNGYLKLCGHSLIAAATVISELGIARPDANGCIFIDTPTGVIKTVVSIAEGEIEGVSFYGVPSFLYMAKNIRVSDYGEVYTEIAFGGVAYAIADACIFGLTLKKKSLHEIIQIATKLCNAAEIQVGYYNPKTGLKEHIHGAILVQRTAEDPYDVTVAVVSVPSQPGVQPFLDRSPCGAGTSARIAAEYAQGRLDISQSIIHRSLLGTKFKGMVMEPLQIGNYHGCIPLITGRAHFTAFMDIVVDAEDPFQEGFVL